MVFRQLTLVIQLKKLTVAKKIDETERKYLTMINILLLKNLQRGSFLSLLSLVIIFLVPPSNFII